MNDIHSRFKSLPRARRGNKSVVIVDEDVLAGLLADALFGTLSPPALYITGIAQSEPWLSDPHAP